jgi:hypothetical protein
VSLRFGVHFSGCGVAAFSALFVYLVVLLSKSRRRCFAADFGSVSGDGRSFRCCTVGELLRDCDLVSVRAVREKCDEKSGGVRFGKAHARDGRGIPPLRLRSGQALFAKCAKRIGHPASMTNGPQRPSGSARCPHAHITPETSQVFDSSLRSFWWMFFSHTPISSMSDTQLPSLLPWHDLRTMHIWNSEL